MSEPYVGEIRMFAGNFAPRSWAYCDGQLLAVDQNDALFSLLGTIYGGDGRTTFGLPDMRGRIPLHAGSGPGLSPRQLGAKGGSETETLTTAQLPSHRHNWNATTAGGQDTQPQSNLLATPGGNVYAASTNAQALSASAVTPTGGSGSHHNIMSFLCVHFIIALFGVYPSRQ